MNNRMKIKTNLITFRVSPDEEAMIKSAAQNAGKSVSGLLLFLVDSYRAGVSAGERLADEQIKRNTANKLRKMAEQLEAST